MKALRDILNKTLIVIIGFLFINTGCEKANKFIPENVIDIDGNIYKTIKIGSQVWLKENLKTTKYNDGEAIKNVTDNTSWTTLIQPSYCWKNNELLNKEYGAFYSWHAVNTAKLCPKGWHIPSEKEWHTLESILGGASIGGGKLKEKGTTSWSAPNTGGTNESGFSGLPCGYRSKENGSFVNTGIYGCWWSSTGSYERYGRFILHYDSAACDYQDDNGALGLSVRCIMDE